MRGFLGILGLGIAGLIAFTAPHAQTSGCGKVDPTTATDIVALQADADCYGTQAQGDNSQVSDNNATVANDQSQVAALQAQIDALNTAIAGLQNTNGQLTADSINALAAQKARLDRITYLKSLPPMPSPQGSWVPSPSLSGLPDANVTGIDRTLGKAKSGFPPTNAPDTVGAFRFICGPGQLLRDDPIVYPGQPGKSHLHQFYGNTSANAYSTHDSLLANGQSTCAYGPSPLNRSAYWMPAVLDGQGNVREPSFVTIYYKRFPKDSIACKAPYSSGCVAIPNGLKMIAGWDATRPTATPVGFHYSCTKASGAQVLGPGGGGNPPTNMEDMLAVCPVGYDLTFDLDFPQCWDGENLDSPDHRSHVAYSVSAIGLPGVFPGAGKCPISKKTGKQMYFMPVFRLHASVPIRAGDDTSKWSLSSDAMLPSAKRGSTLHGDYFEAWDPVTKKEWTDNCIDRLVAISPTLYKSGSGLPIGFGPVSCQGGNLGDGFSLVGAQQPPWGWNPIPVNLGIVPLSSVAR